MGRWAASVNLHHSNKETIIQFITFFRSSSSSFLFVIIFLRYTTNAGLWQILFSHNPHVKMSQQKPSSLPQSLSQFPPICFKILIGHEKKWSKCDDTCSGHQVQRPGNQETGLPAPRKVFFSPLKLPSENNKNAPTFCHSSGIAQIICAW